MTWHIPGETARLISQTQTPQRHKEPMRMGSQSTSASSEALFTGRCGSPALSSVTVMDSECFRRTLWARLAPRSGNLKSKTLFKTKPSAEPGTTQMNWRKAQARHCNAPFQFSDDLGSWLPLGTSPTLSAAWGRGRKCRKSSAAFPCLPCLPSMWRNSKSKDQQ